VENAHYIIDRYLSDARVGQVRPLLNAEERQTILWRGLVGSAGCFVLNALETERSTPLCLIANDAEQAAYWYTTFNAIRDNKATHYLPDPYRKPNGFDEISAQNGLTRSTLVSKIALRAENQIIVTYPEALLEHIVTPETLSKDQLDIQKGEKLDADTAIEVLVDYGFERVDFVYEPGQFAIRGGIIDIFSYGNEWPYRIELFDDDIESIRTFDPMSQLSKQDIARVIIVPNIKTEFKKEDKQNILDILPDHSVLCILDYDNILDRLLRSYDHYQEFSSSVTLKTLDEPIQKHHGENTLSSPTEVIRSMQKHHMIYLGSASLDRPASVQIVSNTKPQPSFNKNFTILIENLQENTSNKINNYLFTENAKQVKRFYSIFEDLEVSVEMQPIGINLHEGFIDLDHGIACYTDHQIFERFHRPRLKKGFSKEQSINLKMLRELKSGDFVTHIDHGIGRYSGLEKIDINGHVQESVRLIYKNNDVLYVSINSLHKISKYAGEDGKVPSLHRLGSDQWKKTKSRTKKKVKDIAAELIKLYAKRKATPGHAFPEDGYLQNELEASFMYEDTPDQESSTVAVKEDMMKSYPMDRLICGDVGFGKTEIAVRAAFKAVAAGKQAAVLVPTTILALQHAQTFGERLKEFGVNVDYINRFKSTKEKNEVYRKVESGEIEILIGTHAILNKKIKFKDLGILIIDEEQKFGVAAKEKLRNLKVNVDTLTLTATPIPRTLQFSLMSARDMSILRTPPPNRQPIYTERRTLDDKIIKEAIYYEINRGGQVFFVHNRVKSLPDVTAMIQKLCPDVDISMAHGQMDPKRLEETLVSFIDGNIDVLVCTNIIETGLDISNANTMIINNAQNFGLSDLHQLRGRVGRSNKRAFCYLFTPPLSVLTPEARKRLRTIEEFSDLGSGFEIAMKDLDIRGAGNLLGAEQSGFISDIGYETYQRILDEAIQELKENEYKELFAEELEKKDRNYVRDTQIEADVEMLIPDSYINNIQERLNLYSELDKIETEDKLTAYSERMADRFGPIPDQVQELFDGLRLRWVCKKLGFHRLSLKNDTMRCFFPEDPQSSYFETPLFQSILQYVGTNGPKRGMSFKQTQKYFLLIKKDVRSLKEARRALEHLFKIANSDTQELAALVDSSYSTSLFH